MSLGFFTHTCTHAHTQASKGQSRPTGAPLEWNTIYVSSLHKGFNHLASLRYHCSEQLLLSGGCETWGSITDSAGFCYCCEPTKWHQAVEGDTNEKTLTFEYRVGPAHSASKPSTVRSTICGSTPSTATIWPAITHIIRVLRLLSVWSGWSQLVCRNTPRTFISRDSQPQTFNKFLQWVMGVHDLCCTWPAPS